MRHVVEAARTLVGRGDPGPWTIATLCAVPTTDYPKPDAGELAGRVANWHTAGPNPVKAVREHGDRACYPLVATTVDGAAGFAWADDAGDPADYLPATPGDDDGAVEVEGDEGDA